MKKTKCEVLVNGGRPGERECGREAAGWTVDGTAVCINCADDDTLAVAVQRTKLPDKISISLHDPDHLSRIGSVLKRAKEHRGMSQEELAERMHTSQGNIPRLLRGDHQPHLYTLLRAARALGLTVRVTFVKEDPTDEPS